MLVLLNFFFNLETFSSVPHCFLTPLKTHVRKPLKGATLKCAVDTNTLAFSLLISGFHFQQAVFVDMRLNGPKMCAYFQRGQSL